MRKKISIGLFILVSFFCLSANAQLSTAPASAKKLLRLARAYTEQGFYEEAERTYIACLQKDTANAVAAYELGMLEFTFLYKKEAAIPYLEKSMQLKRKKTDTVPEICDALGQCYQFVENYSKAIVFYQAFEKKLKNNDGGNAMRKITDRYMEQCMFAEDNAKPAKGIKCTNAGAGVNTANAEFDPVPSESDNTLFFTSIRFANEDGSENLNEEATPNIYLVSKKQGSFGNAHRYHIFDSLEFGSKDIEAGSISYDNTRFFVTKDDKIFMATGKDTTWKIPVMMSDSVNSGFGQNHPFMSADGKTLYFAVNNAGGFGGLDIYKCELQKNGRWGAAKNLGKEINTPFDEEGPSVSADGKTFYFSSKGHVGFGGYDIFKSTIKDTSYSLAENMGRPVNSSADDLFLKFNKAGNVGYFSSGRPKGMGDMDIYKITKEQECKSFANKTYTISLDSKKSVDPAGIAVVYEWDMDDGTMEKGTTFKHVYARPGKYNVKLNVIDPTTGRKDINDTTVVISIDNVSHIEFVSADTVIANDTVRFDASCSMMKNQTPTRYSWKMGEAVFGENAKKVNYVFKNPGTYTVKMQIDFKCNNCPAVESYCYSKNITVLEYNRKEKRRP